MPKTILVVDDSSSLRMAVRIALTGAGYEVVEAEDGKQALTKLDGRKYHLVISDVNMPNLDGYGFVQAMKQLAAYKYTPRRSVAARWVPRPGSSSPSCRRSCSMSSPSW